MGELYAALNKHMATLPDNTAECLRGALKQKLTIISPEDTSEQLKHHLWDILSITKEFGLYITQVE